MLQARYSKFKQVVVSVLLPRFIVKNTKLYNRAATALEPLTKLPKSTDSGNNEEQMHIIEKCFSKNVIEDVTKKEENPKKIDMTNIVSPELYYISRPKQYTAISKLFGKAPKSDERMASKALSDLPKLHSTTSKLEEHKLEQKIEDIDETPHVEAHAPKVEGFNMPPKVLGNESFILELSKKNDDNQQSNLDELAKRCLGSPINDIDKIILEELRNMNKKDTKPKFDIELLRNQCIEFGTDNINSTDSETDVNCTLNYLDNNYKFDRIQPIHLDTSPLMKTDEEMRDYKQNLFVREFASIYLTTDIDDPLKEIPTPISPYEKQAIPFYDYINKGIEAPVEEAITETAAITEEVEEAEIIFNDDAIQREAMDQEKVALEEVDSEQQPLTPNPNISQFSGTFGTLATESDEPGNLQQKLMKSDIMNVFDFQRYFTSSPDQTSGWLPEDSSMKGEHPNSSISATLAPGVNTKTLDIPSDTAISAHQNPDEYYKMSFPDEYSVDNPNKHLERLFAESPVTQIFSALPQQLELEKGTLQSVTIDQSSKDPISNLIPESEQMKDMSFDKSVQSNLEKLTQRDHTISPTDGIPLSILLRRIRQQSRMEYCRDLYTKGNLKVRGTKKFTCPPIDKGKTKPKPCETKPKPACDNVKPCPSPTKKDPCAKFTPIFLTIFKYDIILDAKTPNGQTVTCLTLITGDVIKRLNALGQKLKYVLYDRNSSNETLYARDFEPWIPIPSWPIPKKEKQRPFVCPKEGCKIPMPKPDKQTYKGKQCLEMPKTKCAMSRVRSLFYIYNVDCSKIM